jgi:hypothetical protein
MTMTDTLTIPELLAAAKDEIEAGESSLHDAAEHVAAAMALGATQTEVAAAVGRSQGWVNRLLKWQRSGFHKGGPFGADNAKKRNNISQTNKTRGQAITELQRQLADCDALRAHLEEQSNHQDIAHLVTAEDLAKSKLLYDFIAAVLNSSLQEAA